jgi:predicted house-cleaning noncanonical NTP pyrophosphatase (MazG superfamily)
VSASHAEAELRAKIIEYEGFLNDREEEIAAMMEVMENLQAEISNKNEMINHLQESKPQSQSQSESLHDATNNAKMQQL